jgi:hypothetical protein
MLKIFRKIRQSLVTQNKFSKYLLYAIGEIVLVVIGILIALSINNWNSERINRKQEKEYLSRLVVDLEKDLDNLQSTFTRYQQKLIVGKIVVDQLGQNNSDFFLTTDAYRDAIERFNSKDDWTPPEQFGSQLFQILVIQLFNQTRVTFDEMISTGKIEIIQDQNLRTLIQEYYPQAVDFQNFQDVIVMNVQQNYRTALNENNISSINQGDFNEIQPTLINTKGLIVATENYMAISQSFMGGLYYSEDSMINKINELIGKIRNELESK